MKVEFETMLRQRMSSLTPAERRIASYLLDNPKSLAFETGASIASAVGLSQMTVSRFIRELGFGNLRHLKRELRAELSENGDIDDHMARFQVRDARHDSLRESLRLEMEAIAKAYALVGTPSWNVAVDRLAKMPVVFVAGFQGSKGLALDFSTRLLWTRPNVFFAENTSGTFGEILTADRKSTLTVLIDTASYAARGISLAEQLKERQMPLIIVTDKFSHWGSSYTPEVFEAHTHVKTFWDSHAALNVILNLLIDSVAARRGESAKTRFAEMRELSNTFGELVTEKFMKNAMRRVRTRP